MAAVGLDLFYLTYSENVARTPYISRFKRGFHAVQPETDSALKEGSTNQKMWLRSAIRSGLYHCGVFLWRFATFTGLLFYSV